MRVGEEVVAALIADGLFDPVFYSSAAGIDGDAEALLRHYVEVGQFAGYAPGATFDPKFYARTNPDVVAAGVSPFEHYVMFGREEGRLPTAARDKGTRTRPSIGQLADRLDALQRLTAQIGEGVAMVAAQTAPKRGRAASNRRKRFPRVRAVLRGLRHPKRLAAEIRAVRNRAIPVSFRNRRTRDGWRSTLRHSLVSKAVLRHLRHRITGAKDGTLYKVNQRKPTIAEPRPKILHVIANVWVGGSTQLILDLLDYLGHAFDMHIMTSSLPPGGRHEGMIIHDLSEPTTVESMQVLLGKFQPDLVHIHYWGDVDLPWYQKAFDAAELLNIPVIQNVNTPVPPYVSANISTTIFVSEYVRQQFSPGSGVGEEYVIHPGIDLNRFVSRKAPSLHALDSIGMVYRLEEDKLNRASIELFIEVVRKRPQTRVFIIGGGNLFDYFVGRTEAAGVRDNFVFTGYVPYHELPAYYAQFALFVAPVWKESFGQVTPFAMNMGCAVAGYNVGALPEILNSQEMLGDTIEETSTKIVALLDDPERLRRLGASNHEIAQDQYGVDKMCVSYELVYNHVLGRESGDLMPGYPEAKIFI